LTFKSNVPEGNENDNRMKLYARESCILLHPFPENPPKFSRKTLVLVTSSFILSHSFPLINLSLSTVPLTPPFRHREITSTLHTDRISSIYFLPPRWISRTASCRRWRRWSAIMRRRRTRSRV